MYYTSYTAYGGRTLGSGVCVDEHSWSQQLLIRRKKKSRSEFSQSETLENAGE